MTDQELADGIRLAQEQIHKYTLELIDRGYTVRGLVDSPPHQTVVQYYPNFSYTITISKEIVTKTKVEI